jgi:hypothetical protein
MDRRSLLLAGAGLAATAAGCTSLPGLGEEAGARAPRASLRLDPVDDREIARRLDRHVPDDDTRAPLLDEVLGAGSATRESIHPRLRAGTLVHAGTRYDLPRGRTPRAPFRSLVDRFRSATDVRAATKARADNAPQDATGERSGTYLVRFEGTVHLTRLHLFEPSEG